MVAAALVLTRAPVLSFGTRAYVDLPYVALVLGALALELRRPRAGAPVLALLALAGLLRPEAWLFSGAYLLWIAYVPGERRLSLRPALRLLPLALAAPVGWALVDLVSTGDALASLTGTRDNVDALGRATGLDGLFSAGPRRLGEVVRESGLLAAALGAALGLMWLRARTVVALAATALAFAALAVLALAGLPVVTRYFLLAGALLCTLGGAAARRLAPRPRRAPRTASGSARRSSRSRCWSSSRPPRPGACATCATRSWPRTASRTTSTTSRRRAPSRPAARRWRCRAAARSRCSRCGSTARPRPS